MSLRIVVKFKSEFPKQFRSTCRKTGKIPKWFYNGSNSMPCLLISHQWLESHSNATILFLKFLSPSTANTRWLKWDWIWAQSGTSQVMLGSRDFSSVPRLLQLLNCEELCAAAAASIGKHAMFRSRLQWSTRHQPTTLFATGCLTLKAHYINS